MLEPTFVCPNIHTLCNVIMIIREKDGVSAIQDTVTLDGRDSS